MRKERKIAEENASAAKQDAAWPCRRLPRELQCDRHGSGDFMGHTCTDTAPQFFSKALKGLNVRAPNITQEVPSPSARADEIDSAITDVLVNKRQIQMQLAAPSSPSTRADETVKNRGEVYGDIKANFGHIAGLWNALLGPKIEEKGRLFEIEPHHVAAMMRLLKESRLFVAPKHYDSLVDICGYANVQAEITGARENSADVLSAAALGMQRVYTDRAQRFETEKACDALETGAAQSETFEMRPGLVVELHEIGGDWIYDRPDPIANYNYIFKPFGKIAEEHAARANIDQITIGTAQIKRIWGFGARA